MTQVGIISVYLMIKKNKLTLGRDLLQFDILIILIYGRIIIFLVVMFYLYIWKLKDSLVSIKKSDLYIYKTYLTYMGLNQSITLYKGVITKN